MKILQEKVTNLLQTYLVICKKETNFQNEIWKMLFAASSSIFLLLFDTCEDRATVQYKYFAEKQKHNSFQSLSGSNDSFFDINYTNVFPRTVNEEKDLWHYLKMCQNTFDICFVIRVESVSESTHCSLFKINNSAYPRDIL